MKKDRTIKGEFYLLIVRIFLYTFISTCIAWLILVLYINISTRYVKTADYYAIYYPEIQEEIEQHIAEILSGQLIDMGKYSNQIQGEVVDVYGKHIAGENNIIDDDFDIMESIHTDLVEGNYIYRSIPLIEQDVIKALYVIKAPFGYTINNLRGHPNIVIGYVLLIISPVLFLIGYIFLFTTKLYRAIYKNINILVESANQIGKGNFDFKVEGMEGKEFNKIQAAFNLMIVELKEKSEEILRGEENRKLMISSISHDIKTPITVIKGELELMNELDHENNAYIEQCMKVVNKNCKHIIELTNDLALVGKGESSRLKCMVEKVQLGKLIEDKMKEIATIVYKKEIDITYEINLTKDWYELDQKLIIRILDNILHNSLRFTQKGFIRLEVSQKDDGPVHFKCIDTGVGFKGKEIDKIFDAFYQDTSYKGHCGLGLYISKKIVQTYGGEIKAYNNELGGATIAFYINEIKEMGESR